MKKILHIPKYYPPHIGGIEQVCYMSVRALESYQNNVICFNDINRTELDIHEEVEVNRVGIIGKLSSQPLSISYLWELRKILKHYKPNVIHFHVPNPLVSLYLLLLIPRDIKLIVHYHAEILTSKLIYTCYRPLEKLLFKRANIILVTSPKLRDEAEPLSGFEDKCYVLANAIDTNHLELSESDKEKVISLKKTYNNKKIILTFGRHVPYKGLKYLLEAEPQISNDAVIIIGGSGPLTQELKNQTSSDRVHFVGRIPDDELKIYLHAADIFAFPSITKAEAFGLALAESMYCYTPPVTFSIPASGVNFVSLHEQTGLEVENSNPIAFAAAVNKLLEDDNLRYKMGQNSHNRVVENFSIETYDKNINEIYRAL